ncbi:hypothetical protein LSH36_167g05049 [Paralvinella palmiformis]|uniref:acylaminoacyl-peptidase n=1 Tax=Paralvinella palmiformis TaxID=53620 RepID=A0AAD9N857_9ANNE|nr:hypothetical protein LSH36_167g05049 [Paralvinella palmiformis]
MTEVDVDDVVDVYRTLSSYPEVKSGRINNKSSADRIQVTAVWSQRDLDRGEHISFIKNYYINNGSIQSTQPEEISKVEWSVQSPSGQYRAVVRLVSPKVGEPKQYLEVWDDNRRLHNISVDGLDKHGKIYDDDTFGCLEWSASEDRLLYIAEKKKAKAKSYFEQKGVSEDNDQKSRKGEEYVYDDDWGEQLTGKVQPLPCLLDIKSQTVTVLDCMPENFSAGPAIWCPHDLGIVYVATYNGPFRLGRIYCAMRKSALYHVELKSSNCTMLGTGDKSVHSPIFSPDNSCFVFLENKASGPHAHCSKLKLCKWSDKSIVTVTDIVRNIKTADQFPGIFTINLPRRCWLEDSKRIVITTQWRSKRELVIISCETGLVSRLTNDPVVGSWSLLDIHNDMMLATVASPSQPPSLMFARLPPKDPESEMTWSKLDGCYQPLLDISWQIHSANASYDGSYQAFSSVNFEYIVVKPSEVPSDEALPMIVFPHGGPHAVISVDYMLYTACLCRLGYMIVYVNFRGSFGFGEDSIESLPGSVGTSDVRDVQMAAKLVMEAHKVDEGRVFALGGSHGGFITGHLIGQYPDFYKAAVMRNPVVNIGSMIAGTDIPDWNYVEAGLAYDERQDALGVPDFYAKAWLLSPIKYVDKVTAAVLIVIGQKDRRVSNQQAHEYRKALASRGATVRMLSYVDDCHPIVKVPGEADCFVNIVKWFREHGK